MEKRLLQTLKGEKNLSPPIWFMRQAGRYLPEYRQVRSSYQNFLDLCYDPEGATEVTLQPLRRFSLDAAIIFSDILVVPHALGQSVSFQKDHGPVLSPLDWDSFLKRPVPTETILDHLKPVYDALRLTKKAISPATTLIGFVGGPWTLATYMIEQGKSRDFSTSLWWIEANTTRLLALLEIIEKAILDHALGQIDAGAEVIQIFESWASVVPEAFVSTLLVQPARRLIESIRRHAPDVPVIYFGRGKSHWYPEILNGFQCVTAGLDQSVDPFWAAKTLQPLYPVQGNLCPTLLREGGEELRGAVQKILQAFNTKPFVFNLGHGIMPDTPITHVHEVLSWVADPPAGS